MRINTPTKIIVHHTGGTKINPLADTSYRTFETINSYHGRRWNHKTKSSLGYYIGYHFFIERDGKITQGRATSDEGVHSKGYNTSSIAVCLAGNFDLTMPTPEQIKVLTELLNRLTIELKIPIGEIYPHRAFASKSCYGYNLSDTWAKDLLRSRIIKTLQNIALVLTNILKFLKGRK